MFSLLALDRPRVRRLSGLLVVALVALLPARQAEAQGAMGTTEDATPRELRSVKIDEKLDAQVPLDATFHDLSGKTVRLGDLFDGKHPTLLTFAYYNCPVLCSLILNSAAASMSKIPWTIGRDFNVITISIDPHESLEKAESKREALLREYGRKEAETGWHFLLGDEATIAKVTDAVGYRFHYDEEQKQFAHPGALILLQPDGKVSRYLYGLEYPPNDMRLGLLEASEGKSIGAVDQVLLFCYRYDPHQGKYVVIATRVMQIGAGIIGGVLAAFLVFLWRLEKKKWNAQRAAATQPHVVTPMETRT